MRFTLLNTFLSATFLFTAGLIAAFGQQAVPALEHAVEIQKRGDLQGAVLAYRSYLQVDPTSVPAHANLGAALAGLGRFEEAISEYRAALRIDPDNPALQFNLGLAHFKSARIPDAAADFSTVVAAQPDNKHAVVLLADCYLRMAEYKKVIDLLSPKAGQFGGEKDFVYLLGTAYIHNNEIEKGQALIDQILRQGDTAEVHLMMGAVRLSARDGRGAITEIERAIQLNPNLITAHSTYGRALLQMGEPDKAAEAFRSELKLNPTDFDSNRYLGILLKEDQNYEASLLYLRRALEIHPGAADVRYQIGTAELALHNFTEARQILEDLTREEPNFLEAHVSLASLYYRLKLRSEGDNERAIVQKLTAARQAREPGVRKQMEKPSDTAVSQPSTGTGEHGATANASASAERGDADATFVAMQARATAAREAGDTGSAIELYLDTLKLHPEWPEGWWHLGSLYYTSARTPEARDAFEHFVDLVPAKGGAGWVMLGLCEFQLRDYPAAMEHLGRGVALGFADNAELSSVARYHFALLLNAAGDSESALQVLLPMARTSPPDESLLQALGLATLAERYLPSELPASKRKLTLEVGNAEYKAGARHLAEAAQEFQKLVERYPRTSNIHYSLGVVLLLSNPGAALDQFRKELVITPSHVDARLQIAYEYLKREEPKKGLPFADQAVKLSPTSAPARSILGRLLVKAGQFNSGVAELEKGAKLAPTSPEIAYALANAYLAAGRKNDADREREQFKLLYARRQAHKGESVAGPQVLNLKPTAAMTTRSEH